MVANKIYKTILCKLDTIIAKTVLLNPQGSSLGHRDRPGIPACSRFCRDIRVLPGIPALPGSSKLTGILPGLSNFL